MLSLLASLLFGLVVLGMALLVPNVGEVELLKNILYEAPGDRILKLYKTDVTPSESDTAGSYTVADFTGYADATLTATQSATTWAVPTTSSGTTFSEYGGGTPLSWTNSGASQTIYGYFVVEASGGTLCWAEKFATARTLATDDVLNLTPRLELA